MKKKNRRKKREREREGGENWRLTKRIQSKTNYKFLLEKKLAYKCAVRQLCSVALPPAPSLPPAPVPSPEQNLLNHNNSYNYEEVTVKLRCFYNEGPT